MEIIERRVYERTAYEELGLGPDNRRAVYRVNPSEPMTNKG
jgi:hypothetical protein